MKLETQSKALLETTNLELTKVLAQFKLKKITPIKAIELIGKIKDVSVEQAIKIEESVTNPQKYVVVSINKNVVNSFVDIINDFNDNEFIKNNKNIIGEIGIDINKDNVTFTFVMGNFNGGEDLDKIIELDNSGLVDKDTKLSINIREVK